MGGTSTDVSRFAGTYEHVFETTTAGKASSSYPMVVCWLFWWVGVLEALVACRCDLRLHQPALLLHYLVCPPPAAVACIAVSQPRFSPTLHPPPAGVTIQAPQLDINTVAAGGGSRLFFR